VGAGFGFIASRTALRRLTLACAVTTLAIGFGDTTTYAVITQGLHRAPQFIGVTQLVQGMGAIVGGLSAAAAIRRLGEIRVAVAGLVLLTAAPALSTTSSLPLVLVGMLAAGAAVPAIVVAILTLLQRLSPMHLQGRAYAAFEVATTGPQTAGIGLGAALITFLDYRLMLGAEAVALLLAAVLLARTPTIVPEEPVVAVATGHETADLGR
jgi:MFS family permease